MATYYIHPTLGLDSRTTIQAANPATPWKTPQKAFSTVAAGDVIVIQDGVWDSSDACVSSRGWPIDNASPANITTANVTWRVLAGSNPEFKTPYSTGPKGDPHTQVGSGHVWWFTNPNGMVFDIQEGATLSIHDYADATHPYPVSTYNYMNGNADVPSALMFEGLPAAQRQGIQSGHNVIVRGRLLLPAMQGNGIQFKSVQGCGMEPDAGWAGVIGDSHCAEVSHNAGGVRFYTADGTRFATTLSGATSIGATTINVASVGSGIASIGLNVGNSYISIDSGNGLVEWRKVTAINGTTLTLGSGPYPIFPLQKAHANGVAVRVMVGAIGVYSHANDKRAKSVSGAEFGSEGFTIGFNSHHVLIAQCHSGDNWQYDTVAGYVDGGGIEFYQMRSDSSVWCTENLIHDNQGINETGTGDNTNFADGNWRWDWNKCYGFSDQRGQHLSAPAAAPLGLLRACPYAEIVHNSYWVTNGNFDDGGFRSSPGGSFGGTFNNITIKDNLFVFDYGTAGSCTQLYNPQNAAIPAGSAWHHNYVFYANGYTGRVINHSGTDYTVSQLAAGQAATGQWAGETWTNTVDPLVADGANGDFTVQTGSPLIATASDGTDIGAADFISSGTVYVADTFTRSVTNGFGTADVGGAWTVQQGAVGQFNVLFDHAEVNISANASRRVVLQTIAARDVTGSGRVRFDKVAVGGNVEASNFVRRTSDNANCYRFKVIAVAGGALLAVISRLTATIEVQLASATPANLATYTAGGWIRYRYVCNDLVAGVATLQMRVWADGASEPSAWDVSLQDATGANQVAGDFALFSFAAAAVSNGPILISHDDLSVVAPNVLQTVTPGLISDTALIYAPAQMKQTVTVGKITDTALIYAPSVVAVVGPALITQTGVVLALTVNPGPVFTTPAAITDTALIYTPTVVPGTVFVTPAAIAATPLVYAPSQLTQSLTPAKLDYTAVIYAPTMTSPIILVALIERSTTTSSLAVDTFTRTGSTLGTADSGGAWTEQLSGTSSFETDGSVGKAHVNAVSTMIGASLFSVSALDVDAYMEWEVDKLATGDQIELFLSARTSNSVVFFDGYAAHVTILANNVVLGNFNRIDSAGNRVGMPIPNLAQTVPNAPAMAANTRWGLRFQCYDTNPTQLRMKVWRIADGQPTAWTFYYADSLGPQVPGAVGVRFRCDTGTTNPPFVFSFDGLTYDQIQGAVYSPTFVYRLDFPLISQPAATIQPVIGQFLAPEALTYTASLYDVSVLATNIVDVALIALSPTIYAPTVVANQFVTPDVLASTGVVYDPSMGTVSLLDVDLITQSVEVFEPVLSMAFEVDLIDDTAVIYDFDQSWTFEVPLIDRTAVLHPPEVGGNLFAGEPPVLVSAGIYGR